MRSIGRVAVTGMIRRRLALIYASLGALAAIASAVAPANLAIWLRPGRPNR